ncbi:sigma-70 family RNA polymerase sigma factor [Azospirillum sp. SYSU D00513]|uniref:sigma-70 family RNA polymerase sigma factor n=1 Tax=Azospirillum sp. SYSU D00513 TaxID=2812561 RepID=UPI001A96F3EF|nr:sigma-70 family RNA polymerase sigma factor [Azospirillum sp. SYSU D00513]
MDISSHLGVLRRYALVLTRDADRAEDLVQEAVLRALEGARTLRDGTDPKPWLLSILHNTHVSRCRRLKTEREAESALVQADGLSGNPSAPQAARVELGQTIEALMDLPEEQREVLMLVAIEGMSYRDVADCLGVPLGTVMSRLARGRAALRAATERSTDRPGETGQGPHLRLVR